MAKRLYVGNLPYSIDDQGLGQLFSSHGAILSSKVISDKFSGRSRGFGFVEFENDDDADKAVAAMNGTELEGRNLVVNEAKPMAPREGGFGGGGGRGGRGGGGGGGGRGGRGGGGGGGNRW